MLKITHKSETDSIVKYFMGMVTCMEVGEIIKMQDNLRQQEKYNDLYKQTSGDYTTYDGSGYMKDFSTQLP